MKPEPSLCVHWFASKSIVKIKKEKKKLNSDAAPLLRQFAF
jgi:hypothetical protein